MLAQYARKLAAAASEDDVGRVVRDYLASWHPEELSRIPEECRPGKVRDGEDIVDVAYRLTRARIAVADPPAELLHMETFFAHACSRLSGLDPALHAHEDRNGGSPPA